ncbi:MAG: carboxypeptidase regulatory-like domain-containing protein [Deltaproteobacteria bacterium]
MIVDLFHVESPRSIEVGDAEVHVVVEVSTLGVIEGKITQHGAPVADAVVSCPSSVANNIGDVTTKADGRYRCPGFKPGGFGLTARDVHGRWGVAQGTIANGETKTFDIDLANDGMLCGTVRDKVGAAVSGLVVGANDATQEDIGEAMTASDGTFCIRELANQGTYVLSASLDGQAITLDHPPVSLEHRADVAIVVDLQFGTIAGNVVDSAGAPVADAVIRSSATNTNHDFTFDVQRGGVTITDQAGHFLLTRLPTGSYRIFALARDGGATSTEAILTGTSTVKIVLASAGAIQGRLVGFSTPPIVMGTLMSGGRENVDFEVDGSSFKATGLAPGDYTLQVDTFGHEADSHRVTVRAGETTQVTLSSRGVANVDGVVVDWKTNAPLPNVRCSPPVATEHGNVGGVYNVVDSQAISDAQGQLTMTNVSAGEVAILCVGANLVGGRVTTLPLDRTTTTTLVMVRRDPADRSIGAMLNPVDRSIVRVDSAGAAAHAGLQIDDEIDAVDGRIVTDLFGDALLAVITNRPPGTAAKLTISRGGAAREITVVVAN